MTDGSRPSLPLTAQGLRRVYKGKEGPAVAGLSFDIHAGQIVTFLGPNGAGKTTTVKMCAGMLTPTSGTVLVDGEDLYRRGGHASGAIGLAPVPRS